MGWFRIYVGLCSSYPTLWRAITGTTPNPLRECRTHIKINRHEWRRDQIIGRRPIMLTALVLFTLGSAICGAASSMNILIVGRGMSCLPRRTVATQIHLEAVQGLGAGAITLSSFTISSDLVTLRERGTFTGLAATCVILLIWRLRSY
jgi:MFS family permease